MVIIAACNPQPEVTPSKENMLRSKKWRITGGTITVKKPNGVDTNLKYLDYIDTCYSDDYLKFDSMYFGKSYTGSQKCNAADPEFQNFKWRLFNNDKSIDLYDGFNMIFAVTTSIEPYRFETLATSPEIKLDTIVGRLDTIPGFIKQFIVLDTIRELRYKRYPIPNFDLYGAEITEFSQLLFKVKFSFKTTRIDSTGFHAGAPNNFEPILVNDTADYFLTFSSF
ncbi:hypothetical protein GCM10023093_00290 [Nemorincola caseinilytica]|uniref:Lipoprotein n=2 Tax=Nemorincola caseinilytica TaxID=2054315 RepID=A0ABP8N0W3_9BACT